MLHRASRRAGLYAALALALVVSGCIAPDFESRRVYEAPFDAVWDATQRALEERGVQVDRLAKEQRVLVTEAFLFGRGEREIDTVAVRPVHWFAHWGGARYVHLIQFAAVTPERTLVDIETEIEAYEIHSTRKWHECKSRGVLEEELFDTIAQFLPLHVPEELQVPEELTPEELANPEEMP